jgi:hypothetical protein
MLKLEKDQEINCKLTAITRGPRQSLDWIEVPTGVWYYSHIKKKYIAIKMEYSKHTQRGLRRKTSFQLAHGDSTLTIISKYPMMIWLKLWLESKMTY